MTEHPVGEVFELGSFIFEAFEGGESCTHCSFVGVVEWCQRNECRGVFRADGKEVIFQEVPND